MSCRRIAGAACFCQLWKSRTWVDPLAIWHSKTRSSLAYADGHAEIRRWVDQSTIEMSRDQIFLCTVPEGEGEDLRFMVSGFPQKSPDISQSGSGVASP